MLTFRRKIRDNVHGTIGVTELEDLIIDHPFVQRLRRIRQTAFLNYVFPGASHSRFEHSLGVMHLAGVAWEKIAENQYNLAHTAGKFADFAKLERLGVEQKIGHGLLHPTFAMMREIFESDYTLQALRIAALLHDLGHSPFSHSGELFFPTWKEMAGKTDQYPEYLQKFLKDYAKQLGDAAATKRVRHEVFTLILADHMLRDIYREQQPKIRIEPQDIASIIHPMIPPLSNSPLQKFGVHQLCHEILSGEFDIDRMDYLQRDSKECGVVYGIFDESRILNSLIVYSEPETMKVHLGLHLSGLAAFEDYLRARQSMYLQLYFHKTSAAAEAMLAYLSQLMPKWTFPTEAVAYAAIDDHNVGAFLLEAATKRIHSQNDYDYFVKLMNDLLFARKLWKRVFEVSSHRGEAVPTGIIDEAATIIKSLGYRFEKVSSKTSLTRFLPRSVNEPSKHYLRLIKKDAHQFPRVVPIEDYLSVVSANSGIQITRLYAENEKDGSGGNIPDLIREKLFDLLKS